SVRYLDLGIARAFLLHEVKEYRGVMGMEPYASMRCGSPQSIDRVAAVDRITVVEEDGEWHRRVVVRGGETISLQSLRSIDAIWGCHAVAAGGDGPHIADVTILDDEHALRHLIDENVKLCLGTPDGDKPCQCGG